MLTSCLHNVTISLVMNIKDVEPITVRQLQHNALDYFNKVDDGETVVIFRKSPNLKFYKIVAIPMKGVIK